MRNAKRRRGALGKDGGMKGWKQQQLREERESFVCVCMCVCAFVCACVGGGMLGMDSMHM